MVPSCTSPENPPKYEPISCGDCKLRNKHITELTDELLGCQMRFALEDKAVEERLAAQKKAPSAVIVAA